MRHLLLFASVFVTLVASQGTDDFLTSILERLETLEAENELLAAQVKQNSLILEDRQVIDHRNFVCISNLVLIFEFSSLMDRL